MSQTIAVNARSVAEDGVWIATSADVAGLVVEAPTWSGMIDEVRLVLPDLLDFAGAEATTSLVFRAEERMDLAAA